MNNDKKIQDEEIVVHSVTDIFDVPYEYYVIDVPKLKIVKAIKEAMDEQKVTYRSLAKEAKTGMATLGRITAGENYTIDNLLSVLDKLNLELVVREREGDPTKIINPFVEG